MGRSDLKAKIRLEGDASDANKAIDSTEGRLAKLGKSVRANALKITAALASIAVAFRQIEAAATLEGQRNALERNLAAQGIALDGFIDKLKEVSDAQVSTAQLIESSGKALLLGIPAKEIAGLLDIAKASAIATGSSVAQAFDDIATGIGRASPLILDNLGIVVKLGPAYEDMAASLGKSVSDLTALEQKQALLNEVLKVGVDRVNTFGDAQSELSRRLAQGSAAFTNFKNVAGQAGGALALGFAAVLADTTRWTLALAEGMLKLGKVVAAVASIIPGFTDKANAARSSLQKWDDQIDDFQKRLEDMSDSMSKAADISFKAALGFEDDAAAVGKLAAATNALAGSTSKATPEVEELSEAFSDASDESSGFSDEIVRLNQRLVETVRQITITTAQFDKLAEAQGRAAAVTAAVESGGQLVQGGTRVRIRGGSRLTSPRGFNSGPSGGTFTTVTQPPRALPNGRLEAP